MLLVLERLSPTERAAYILREAFDYPYDELASMLETTAPAVRQLVSRARKRIRAEGRTEVTGPEQKRLLTAFIAAARSGDLPVLERLLTADAVSYSDGNGARQVSKFPVVGGERVAKFHRAFASHFWNDVRVELGEVNGAAGAMLYRDNRMFAVCIVSVSADGIREVMWQFNGAKLTAVA
ncbi:sigma factor-like helix-turn-helix DNA-binding protein [Kribbella sp. GL6]|uniref:sigma factor-like helix-turn-helix DNA-binding protein n=1 Tax=Kribbella sp. GL6 TaxID=3419765 RepID=UPI003D01D94B